MHGIDALGRPLAVLSITVAALYVLVCVLRAWFDLRRTDREAAAWRRRSEAGDALRRHDAERRT